MTPSAGIEPTSQEPESYVLSVAPRGQILATYLLYAISVLNARVK